MNVMILKACRIILIILIPLIPFGGCENNSSNFSRFPGFAEYFAANPPSHESPDQGDQQQLRRYQPRFMRAEGHQDPVDFYRDYIANGVLVDGAGNVISSEVTQALLNEYRDNPHVVFRHVPGHDSEGATVYGRIDRELISFPSEEGEFVRPFTFLTYNIVFRHSGLSAGIPAWQEVLLDLFFDLNDWHQLDHYTAVTLVLEEDGDAGASPVAVMLQQHDNLRTYLLCESVNLPEDGRVIIDIAKRSNELYPHVQERTKHRAVYRPDPKSMYFLMTGERKPLLAGYDITDSVEEVEYTLSFLPHDDAFYTFQGYLGERRRLKGRDAPPGARYNTLPELKPLGMQLFSGYWREGNRGDIERLERTLLKDDDYARFAELQGAEFYRNWKNLQRSAPKVLR